MKRLVFEALALLCLFIAADVSRAAERNLRVSYAAPVTTFLPLWAGREAGFFQKHGLRVELVYVGSSSIALSAFLAGEIDILVGGGTAGPTAYLRGFRDLALSGALENRFPFKLYAVPSITHVSQLRGKRFGVSRFGGTADFAARYFLKGAGLDPRKDIQWQQVGGPSDLLLALKAGSIDGGILAFPYNISAQRLGYRELADLTQNGVRYAASAFFFVL